MWGNRLGWMISAGIVGIWIWMMSVIIAASTPTPPTGFLSGEKLGPIPFPSDIQSVIGQWDASIDSTNDYESALDIYAKDTPRYESILEPGRKRNRDDLKLPAVELLLHATNGAKFFVFEKSPDEIITWDHEPPRLMALETLGKILIRLALQCNARDNPERDEKRAQKLFQASVSLGYKLASERVCYREFSKGNALLGESLAGLALAYGASNPQAAAKVVAFDEARRAISTNNILEVWRIVSSIDDKIITRHAGDVALLAAKSEERMWRVEATLKLGRTRFFAGRAGDQHFAERKLKQMAADEADPRVRLAAKMGRDLTLEQYRTLQ